MSKPFNKPNLLTKDRLKRELENNGIKLPKGDQKKDVYVKLYQENVSPKSVGRLGNGEFSSDDDYEAEPEQTKQIVPRSSRNIRKVGSKEIISAEIKSMTNEELKEELSDLGQAVGPILPSTRALYEQKLARLQASSPNNAGTIATVTKSEFSDDNDFDEGHEPEEESIPNDEFFYGGNNQRSDNFGSRFSKNFEKSSTKKEVVRDFSVSSSRNVERSSTFDRKTVNKVRSKNGDKFEEKSWSSSGDNEKDEEEAVNTNRLPTSIQKALSAARRLTPEKDNGAGIRARPSAKQKPEQIPDERSRRDVQEKPMEEDPKKKQSKTSSRKWWILLIILIVLAFAVVYNFEHLPKIQQFDALLENSTASPENVKQQ